MVAIGEVVEVNQFPGMHWPMLGLRRDSAENMRV
jgi:hypothetical protein